MKTIFNQSNKITDLDKETKIDNKKPSIFNKQINLRIIHENYDLKQLWFHLLYFEIYKCLENHQKKNLKNKQN